MRQRNRACARSASGLIAAFLLFAVPAAADKPLPRPSDDVQHRFSLTISPLHLILPVAELTGEYRLTDKIGIAAVLGAGAVTVESGSGSSKSTDSFTVYEAGISGRYYILGSFIHGMQLGAEVLYVHISGDGVGDSSSISGTGQGLAIGPFAGYKIATNIGFTFDAQLGYAYYLLGADAEDSDTGETDSASASGHGLLLNLNVGWSF